MIMERGKIGQDRQTFLDIRMASATPKVSLADLMALKSAIDLNAINELLKPEVWTINLSYSKANELLSTQSAAFENEPGKTSWGNE
jgi:hypothetical protein